MESTVLEPPAAPAYWITKENAREMGAKANQVRWSQPQKPRPPKPLPILPADPYLAKRITCVREQIAKLDRMIADETDPQRMDRLASALGRFHEIERQLSNRPLPGSLKPTSRSSKSRTDVEPME